MSDSDQLQNLLDEAVAACSRLAIAVVRGWVEPPEQEESVIHCDPQTATEDFIQMAATLKCPIVVVDVSRLEQADWDRASAILEELDSHQEGGPSAAQRESILNARDCVGQLASVSLTIFPSGVPRIELTKSTVWCDDLFGLLEDEEDIGADLDEPGDDGEDDEVSEAMARALALSPAFQRAKTAAAREFEARKFIRANEPAGRVSVQSGEVAQLAKSIFEGEIRPQLEAQARARARELLDAGMPKGEVAEKLSLTKRELERLL